ncbi:MAG: hypothetical protein JSW30_04550 [Dehalococcoidia bacterium]|nr:MAG: hypothetical protein JSW30_04550 [Dehalococcoidia bacterium]
MEKLKTQDAELRGLGGFEEFSTRLGYIPNEESNRRLEKKLQTYEKIYMEFNHSLGHLQKDFMDFAKRLADKVDSIDKYQMGKVFKYNKKCPTCQRF